MRPSYEAHQRSGPVRAESLADPNVVAVVTERVQHLTPADREALRAAVAALYFDDSADYETALWTVVAALLGFDDETTDMLEFQVWAYALHPEWGMRRRVRRYANPPA